MSCINNRKRMTAVSWTTYSAYTENPIVDMKCSTL